MENLNHDKYVFFGRRFDLPCVWVLCRLSRGVGLLLLNAA
jgi:hypothetical protein